MPNSSIPAAGEAMPAVKGQLIPFHPAIRQMEPIGIPEDFIPHADTINRRYLIAARLALHTCNKDGAELLSITKALSENRKAFDDMRRNWDSSAGYFEIMLGILDEARKRIEICAQVAGITLNEVV